MNVFGKVLLCTSLLCFAGSVSGQTPADVPVIKITTEDSSVRFAVKASPTTLQST
jgi:hypothetical protein